MKANKPASMTAMYTDILAAGYYVSLSTSSNGYRHGCTVTLTAKRIKRATRDAYREGQWDAVRSGQVRASNVKRF